MHTHPNAYTESEYIGANIAHVLAADAAAVFIRIHATFYRRVYTHIQTQARARQGIGVWQKRIRSRAFSCERRNASRRDAYLKLRERRWESDTHTHTRAWGENIMIACTHNIWKYNTQHSQISHCEKLLAFPIVIQAPDRDSVSTMEDNIQIERMKGEEEEKKKNREWYLNRSLISVDVNRGRARNERDFVTFENFFVCTIAAGTSSAQVLASAPKPNLHWCIFFLRLNALFNTDVMRWHNRYRSVRNIVNEFHGTTFVQKVYIFICCAPCEYRWTKKMPDTRQPRRRSQSSNKRNSCVCIEIARLSSCCCLFWFVSQLYFPLVVVAVVVVLFYYYCCAALAQFVRDAFVLLYNFNLNNGFLCKHL